MRHLRYILLLAFVLVLASCQRRPFAEKHSAVNIVLKINTRIVNCSDVELPQYMRVDLYDTETSELVYTDYIGPQGGYIGPEPGLYDMLVYSIGSESTIVHNQSNYNAIEAYTNEISSFLKSQIGRFLTKAPRPSEPVVNQPDHIFIGWVHNVEVPVIYEHDDVREIVVEVDAHTIVETWQVEVRNVQGEQWINETISLISGQKGSVHIGPNVASEKVATVYFEMKLVDREDGGKSLMGKFNTFGRHPYVQDELALDLCVKDVSDGDQIFHYDVTRQFIDNEARYILIEEALIVKEPKVEGGGFRPVVDEWEEVRTDIDL